MQETPTRHPDPETLAAFGLGRLSETDAQDIELHVADCEVCRRKVEEVPDDAFVRFLQSPASGKATPGQQDGAKTQADLNKPTAADDLGYLTASTKPGSLGRLEHYEILEIVGKGGFGTVLRAFDEKLHRVVAIKVLAPDLSSSGPARQRFIREARSAAAVVHEHVVAIHAVGDEHRPPYLVMQMIDGFTLQQKLDETGTLSLREILRIGMQMAQALDAAHKKGLVHRDVKPANVLLEQGDEHVKITDFGLARAVDDASLTQSGMVAGTPVYMSPEQAEGLPIDHRSDLFSLGTVLYAMCTGQLPFRASGTHAVLKRVIEAAPRPIRESNRDIPDWLCAAIAKLHAKKPEDRLQTAKEVAELLGQRLADMQSPLAHARGASRRGWTMAASMVLALVTFTAVGFYAFRGLLERQPPADPPALANAPFDANKAREHQEAWASYLGKPVEFENVLRMKMRLIPPGEFMMGLTQDEVDKLLPTVPEHGKEHWKSETPLRRVKIEQPFYLGVHEVTVGQFREFVKANNHKTTAETNGKGGPFNNQANKIEYDPKLIWSHPRLAPFDDHPVVMISAVDARAFCEWLSQQTKERYFVPDETQWEYACRAGTTGPTYWGDDRKKAELYEWLYANSQNQHPKPVGTRLPNPFGLFDMLGNASEITQGADDRWVQRGGHAAFARGLRASFRIPTSPDNIWFLNGLRVALAIAAKMPSAPTEIKKLPPRALAPFNALEAKVHQEVWAKYLGTKVETVNSVGARMILIPPGEFLMGSSDEQIEAALAAAATIKADQRAKDLIQYAERPQHCVVISKPFLMGATEVTIGQFKKFAAATGHKTDAEKNPGTTNATYRKPPARYGATDDSPAVIIAWSDAVAYCNWLSEEEKVPYRLPTEAEWEYACRAGTTTQYSFGDDHAALDKYACHRGNSFVLLKSVAGKLPNAFGLFDMHGSVWEYCQDWWHSNAYEESTPHDPTGPRTGDLHVLRGGSWNNSPSYCRSAFRIGAQVTGSDNFGFRCVRDWPLDPRDGKPWQ